MSDIDSEGSTPRPRGHRRSRAAARAALLTGAVIMVVALIAVIAVNWPLSAGRRANAGAPRSSSAPPGSPSGRPAPSPSTHPSTRPPTTPSATPSSPRPSSAKPSAPKPSSPRPSPVPPKVRGGKPGASNTGVPAGTHLKVVNGDQVYSTANQVISGLDVHGFVQIRARNVTIKNSIIRGGGNPHCNSSVLWIRADSGASATIEDTEIAPSHPSPCLDGIWATNATLLRLDIHGAVDGVKAYDNVTLDSSYVHDLSWFASDPNQGGGPTHNDDVQTYEGNRHITLRHNTMSPGAHGNATYQVTQDGGKVSTDLRIDGNWLDGGGCTLNFAHKGGPTPMTGIYVTNNRFGRHSIFGCPILVSTKTILSQVSGNVWDDTGKPIPPPQRHD